MVLLRDWRVFVRGHFPLRRVSERQKIQLPHENSRMKLHVRARLSLIIYEDVHAAGHYSLPTTYSMRKSRIPWLQWWLF